MLHKEIMCTEQANRVGCTNTLCYVTAAGKCSVLMGTFWKINKINENQGQFCMKISRNTLHYMWHWTASESVFSYLHFGL